MEESLTLDEEYADHPGFATVNEDEQAVLYTCGEESETLVEGRKMFQSLSERFAYIILLWNQRKLPSLKDLCLANLADNDGHSTSPSRSLMRRRLHAYLTHRNGAYPFGVFTPQEEQCFKNELYHLGYGHRN